ncbi:hypothetical protein P43SY_001881 [Pythium insidiosum]|uniref:Glycoside hydrolase family 19 catalytic domain-containing protein n=1 Tax=Pythium insidiosum TaxID=114742 RepID=A0AAD5M9B1_PYTIN|nr:hypothetical protein P43SY_001881 [Pythium insidiosum]
MRRPSTPLIITVLWLALCDAVSIDFGSLRNPPGAAVDRNTHLALESTALRDVLPEWAFKELFPLAHRVYSYKALAAALEKLFNGDAVADLERRRRELAMFLTHVAVETSDLRVVEQRPASERFCDSSLVACAATKSYHARGPLSLQGNADYARCSRAIGRRDLLVTQPELVATSPEITWLCAVWRWQRDEGLGSPHEAVAAVGGRVAAFRRTTALLKGGVECGPMPLQTEGDAQRVDRFLVIAKRLNVTLSDTDKQSLSCTAMPTRSPPDADTTRVRLETLLPERMFARLFPSALAVFSFDGLLTAAAAYPTFALATPESDDGAKAELAAFLAHVTVQTSNLTRREDETRERYSDDVFCDPQRAPCVDGRSYHGRGALMLRSNAAYAALGRETGQDLLKNPDAVARQSDLAWRAGLFAWMTDQLGCGRAHDAAATPDLLARTSWALYGPRLCASPQRQRLPGGSIVVTRPIEDATRLEAAIVSAFRRIATVIGLPSHSQHLDERGLLCRSLELQLSPSESSTSPLQRLLPETLFTTLFPHAHSLFSYRALTEAARQFPSFAGEDSDAHNRHELAAFLTHAALASRNWTWLEAPNAALYDATAFCDLHIAPCVPSRRYHARGAMPIQWNYNYAKCGAALGVDLLGNPDLLRLDATLAWRAALWFWMEQRPVSPFGSLHAVMHRHLDAPDDNFRLSTQLLAVAMDGSDSSVCGRGSDSSQLQRAQLFVRLCQALGLRDLESPERLTALQCQPQLHGPRAGAIRATAPTTALRQLLSPSQFHAMIDPATSHRLYSYEAFLAAAATFPGFAGAANTTASKRELAAFLAHVALASRNFTAIEDEQAAATCKTRDACYHGRGPLLLSGLREYEQFERMSHEPVAQHPNAVLVSSEVAWRSAFFVWTARQRGTSSARVGGPTTAHEFALTPFALAGSSAILTPPLCHRRVDSSRRRRVQERVTPLIELHRYYSRFASMLELEDSAAPTCLDDAFVDFDAAPHSTGETNTRVLWRLLPKELFHELFPLADPLYSYHTFISAASRFPSFVNDGSERHNRFELAAFVAQMAHASGNFSFTQQAGATLFETDAFCSKTLGDSCNPNERYHGRGPIQLTWNYNYKAYGDSIGVDLVNHPNWVATDATIAWGSALWYWMTPFQPFGSIHDVFRNVSDASDFDFARTTMLLNGRLECGANPVSPDPETQRIALLKRFASVFGVSPGRKLSCHSRQYSYAT